LFAVPLISVAGIRRGTLDILDMDEREALADARQQQLEKLAGVAIEYVESWQTLQRLK